MNVNRLLTERRRTDWLSMPWLRLALALIGVGLVAGITISCTSTAVSRTVSIPSTIPGAEAVGSESCADCHYEMVRDFRTASHANLIALGTNAMDAGCESCHGPGSLHSDSGGEPNTIVNPGDSPDTCFTCHLAVRGQFSLPYTHPLGQNRMSCGTCHDPHRGPAIRGGGTAMLSESEQCLGCHQEQRGPFVFPHEVMREGCTMCHHPHASVNAKLLVQRNATLCLKCHFQQQTGGGRVVIGGADHTLLLPQGTCWSAGCHEAVHGSHVNSSLRY